MEEYNSSTLISEDIENVEEETTEEITQEEETVVDETPEGVEVKAEEEPQGKFYTDEEFNKAVNEIADRRVARKMRKINREIDKYRDTENVLKSQLGGETIEEVNTKLRKLYTDEGVSLPEQYVSEDKEYLEYLATTDSEDIIKEGFKATEEEANRLASIGYDNLNYKDKLVFTKLVESIDKQKDIKTLKGLNIDPSILDDESFIEYRSQFNRNVAIDKIYDMYTGVKETKVQTPGDLSNVSKTSNEYFTDEEIEALTDEDLDDPAIWAKLRKTQTRNNI